MSRCGVGIQEALIREEQTWIGPRVAMEFLQIIVMDECHNLLHVFHDLFKVTLEILSWLALALNHYCLRTLGDIGVLQLQTIYCMIVLKDTTLEGFQVTEFSFVGQDGH
jgi:hypothetical protein